MIQKKWVPVSRLREALVQFAALSNASAGEGGSDKIMRKEQH
jgi:hypothetical protein